MKILGNRSEPFSAIRKRALAQAGAQHTVAQSTSVDKTAFLGLSETDLTPPVQAAIRTLLTEIDDLRGEVGRLKARLSEAEAQADQDALTPALNRRAFIRELRRIAAFSQRYGSPASVIFFDMDGFKAVNDRFGHAAGDAALKTVAHRLAVNVRDSDIVGRIGGDEFAVILAQADPSAAEAKAGALKAIIEGAPADLGSWSVPLRVSYGVSAIEPGGDPEVALAAADQAMLAGKRARA